MNIKLIVGLLEAGQPPEDVALTCDLPLAKVYEIMNVNHITE